MTCLVQPIGRPWRVAACAALASLLALRSDEPALPAPTVVLFLGVAPRHQDRSFAQFEAALSRQSGGSRYRLQHLAPPAGERVTKTDPALPRWPLAQRVVYVAPVSRYAALAQREGAPWPVVFSSYREPVAAGLMARARQPGGRLTGISLHDDLDLKRLALLHDAAPQVRSLGVLVDDDYDEAPARERALRAAGGPLGLTVQYHAANSPAELDALMASPAAARHDAWYVPPTNLSYFARDAIVAHIRRLGAYGLFAELADVQAGGQMAYVQDGHFAYDALADLTLRVLRGEDPGTIPIERPKRYLLVVRTGAGTERTPIAPAVLRRADVVIGD